MARHVTLTYSDIMDGMKEKPVELPQYAMIHAYVDGVRYDIDIASGEHGPVLNISSPEGGLVVQPIVSNSVNIKVGKI